MFVCRDCHSPTCDCCDWLRKMGLESYGRVRDATATPGVLTATTTAR